MQKSRSLTLLLLLGVGWPEPVHATAPRLFPPACRLRLHQRLIPACASTASVAAQPGDHFTVQSLTTRNGEADPGSNRVLASLRGWRAYDEYMRPFNGAVVWVDNMEAFGPCVQQRIWDPWALPNVAKLVSEDTQTSPYSFDPPELGGGSYVGFAAGTCGLPSVNDAIKWSETTVRYFYGSEMYRSCVDDSQTENQVFVHELAHLYHLDHVTDSVSIMNPTSNAAHPCRPTALHVSEAKPDGEIMAAIWDDLSVQGTIANRRPLAFDVAGSSVAGINEAPFRDADIRTLRGSWMMLFDSVHVTLMNLMADISGFDVEILAVPTTLFYEPDADGNIQLSSSVSLGSTRIAGPFVAGNYQARIPFMAVDNGSLAPNRDYWLVLHVSQSDGSEFDLSDDFIFTRKRIRILP